MEPIGGKYFDGQNGVFKHMTIIAYIETRSLLVDRDSFALVSFTIQ